MNKILDHGYIKTVAVLGDDKTIVNAARVSYDKEISVLTHKDEKLIEYLVKEKHDSPLRHASMTFEVYAPLMVARQWWKHAIGSTHSEENIAWNESSRRYITETPTFYIPDQFFQAPQNSKQGSGDYLDYETSEAYKTLLNNWYEQSEQLYEQAMDAGIAPEQARLFLPAYGLYVRWRWTASLNALLHFATLRLGEGAQSEIVEYGLAVVEQIKQHFPITTDAWIKHRV